MSLAPTAKTPATSKTTRLIAVAGNPNCGKTTLFNALTGLRHKVGNYAGVTVEKREGAMLGEPGLRLLDLPGIYSLSARSLDEQISRDVLLGRLPGTPKPDAVMVVVDAGNLERNLYLATQVIELGLPTLLVCNMMDLVAAGGHRLDLGALSERLGVPVIGTVASRGEGVAQVRAALKALPGASGDAASLRQWHMSPQVEEQVGALASAMSRGGYASGPAADGAAILLLAEGEQGTSDGLPKLVGDALQQCLARLAATPDCDPALEITASRYGWLAEVVGACLVRGQIASRSTTDRLDRVLTHKVWGLTIFAGMMGLLFCSIFLLADPLMGAIESGVGWVQGLLVETMSPGVLRDLLVNGVLAGVGAVVVFFPQICLLFLFIALLEDTGYMSRAAFLMDRVMSRVGLHGKSFIPLLSSHACAIPGILSTRTIENRKDRLTTILVAPLMSCSARLPVYTLLIAACLPASWWVKAGTMFAMYALGIVSALSMATLFKKTLLRGPTPAFIMELPPYRVPRLSATLRVMWDRSKLFLTRAGTTILAIVVLLWALTSYPKDAGREARFDAMRAAVSAGEPSGKTVPGTDVPVDEALAAIKAQEAAEALADSYAGRLGHAIEPVIKPLGYDWRIGIGLIASFAAREVFVGTMGVVYSVGDEADEESVPLREQIAASTWPDGRRVFTPLVAVGLMVFYVLACQCVSTIAVVRRETGGWRWPAFMFGYMTVLAYVGALVVYQIGSALGLG